MCRRCMEGVQEMRGRCMEGAREMGRRCMEGALWVVNSFKTSNVHHCLSLVTIGCP